MPAIIPAGTQVNGVTCRVLTSFDDVKGLTTFSIGDGSDTDRWGSGIARTAATTTAIPDFTISGPVYYRKTADVVLTADTGTFDAAAGSIRCTVHFMNLVAETS